MSLGVPSGWDRVPLAAIFEPRSGRVSPTDFPDSPYIGLEHVEAHTNRLLGTVPAATMSSSAARFFANDVLYGRMRPYLNKVVCVPFDGLASAEFIVFPETAGVVKRFLLWRLSARDFVQFACSQYEGDRPRVKFDQLGKFELRLPPAAEQTRIVEKLEELLSDLDAGIAELNAAQKKLVQYRQSLLKAAVDGTLTALWRETQFEQPGEPKETGAQLLKLILTERRGYWEAKQLAKYVEQDKTPPTGWKGKYIEPQAPKADGMPALPTGWLWVSLDQILCDLRSGTAETSGRDATRHPVLKSSAVRQGEIDFEALNYLREDQSQRRDNYLMPGDVLITRLSGSVEYVGCCAVVGDLPVTGVQYPDRIFCGKLSPSLMWLGDYLVCCFRSRYVRERLEAAAKSTAGHKRISLSDLYPLPIPLPPASEIREILLQTSEVLQRADDSDCAIEIGLKQSAAQRQNILKAAFSGQLVPQDPNDEPAAVLLRRGHRRR